MESPRFHPEQETLPFEQTPELRGADLARAVIAGTLKVEDIGGREMTDEEAAIAHAEMIKKEGEIVDWDKPWVVSKSK